MVPSSGTAIQTQASRQPAVGIIVVHYNNLNDTMRCLHSLSSLSYTNHRVIVVDNCSPNGSGELLSRLAEGEVTVICSPENQGFAAGNNIGIRQALSCDAEYVWLLNPDTEVEPDALGALVEEAERDEQIAAVGSKILYAPGAGCSESRIWGAGGTVDTAARVVAMRGSNAIDRGQYDSAEDMGYLPGCSLLVRRAAIEKVGYLPEEYFMYFEETDWCRRMLSRGFRLRYMPQSIVYHHFTDSKMQTPTTVYYYNRNERLFWSRWSGSRLRIFAKTAVRDLPQAVRALRAAPSAEHRRLFTAHVRSCSDFLLGRFGKRRPVPRP